MRFLPGRLGRLGFAVRVDSFNEESFDPNQGKTALSISFAQEKSRAEQSSARRSLFRKEIADNHGLAGLIPDPIAIPDPMPAPSRPAAVRIGYVQNARPIHPRRGE